MSATRLLLGASLALALTTSAFAATSTPTLQDKQQAACYDDVQKLCGSVMPDVSKVTACMKDKKPVVSAKCAALWDVAP